MNSLPCIAFLSMLVNTPHSFDATDPRSMQNVLHLTSPQPFSMVYTLTDHKMTSKNV